MTTRTYPCLFGWAKSRLIETMARAMYRLNMYCLDRPPYLPIGWDHLTDGPRRLMLSQAEAALDAICPPEEAWIAPHVLSDRMLQAMYAAHLTGKWGYSPDDDRRQEWAAARDAILSELPKTEETGVE